MAKMQMPTKMMQKGMQKIMRTSPLDMVIMTQKEYMDSFRSVQGKIDTVNKALLKWSYVEPNPGLAQAFSCWADLDFAFGQLILQLCDKGVQYRQVFKDIREQGIEWSKVKQEKNKATNDVTSCQKKVENLRKSKKIDQPKIDSAEAELQLAKVREEEMTEVLRVKTKEFEEYKAKSIRDALLKYSSDYLEAISTMKMIYDTKKEIGEMMNDKPVYAGQELPNGYSKVEPVFQKLDLELPMRDAALDRHQINRTVSAPPLKNPSPISHRKPSGLQEHLVKHFPVSVGTRGVKRLKRLKKSKSSGVRLVKYRKTYSPSAHHINAGRPASTVVYKTDFSDSDSDDDCYEYPEDPVPNASKSMTLPATFANPPKLPAPNPTNNEPATKTGPRLPPNAIRLVEAPPKLPPARSTSLSQENDDSDSEDDHDYQYPEESFGSSNPSINTAVTEEEEYIVPNTDNLRSELAAVPKPKSKKEKIENAEHEDGPGAVYFEVEEKNPDQTRLPPGISTPDVERVDHPSPPEEGVLDDYYGNITPEQANKLGLGADSGMNRNNSQASNVSPDTGRKPAILPKPKGSKSPQILKRSSTLDDTNPPEGDEEYVICNISGENNNADMCIDDGETYDMVCVEGAPPTEIYGNVEFLETAGHMGSSNNHLSVQDASSSKGPMPTPRNKKITHTYFNPGARKEEPPKRQPPRSPLPSRPR